jgi:hypothetical protein
MLPFFFSEVKICFWLGTMAHTCNPSYLEDGDWEDHGSSLAQAKGFRGSISINKSWAGWCMPVTSAMK